jgi:hypothetical protein
MRPIDLPALATASIVNEQITALGSLGSVLEGVSKGKLASLAAELGGLSDPSAKAGPHAVDPTFRRLGS